MSLTTSDTAYPWNDYVHGDSIKSEQESQNTQVVHLFRSAVTFSKFKPWFPYLWDGESNYACLQRLLWNNVLSNPFPCYKENTQFKSMIMYGGIFPL